MTVHYHSLDKAFGLNPTQIADWGYMECSESDLRQFGVEFFDDIEDPGTCRRAAFHGQSGAIVVLTIYSHLKPDTTIFASSARICGLDDFLKIFPKDYSGMVKDFDIIYFDIPT